MGERKVLNKYYPPDFDPAKLPKGKQRDYNEMKVRMMLPMSVRCQTCGNFMYKGTKFNTRKEDVLGETYLGIQIFRFYYRCKNCAAEFTMKTDPKTSDYVMEYGASRNYEPWREADVLRAEAVRSREEEERGNAMKALENRTKDSKREMDIMEALDEMRSLKARHAGITTEQALNALQREGLGAGDDGSGSGGDDGGGDRQRAEDGAGAHRDSSDEDLPEEDRRAMAEFLAQRQTILKRLDSDDESEGRRHGGGGGGGGHDTTSKAGDAVPGPSSSTAAVKAAPQGAPRAPTIKVAVRAKRPQPNPTAGAAGDDKRHRSDAAGDAASILGGLIGGYGSSGSGSGSEDGAG